MNCAGSYMYKLIEISDLWGTAIFLIFVFGPFFPHRNAQGMLTEGVHHAMISIILVMRCPPYCIISKADNEAVLKANWHLDMQGLTHVRQQSTGDDWVGGIANEHSSQFV